MEATSVAELPKTLQYRLQDTLNEYAGLQAQLSMFASEFASSLSVKRAREASGLRGTAFKDAGVQALIVAKLEEHDKRSQLNAEYVREYIHTVLEFQPMDFFTAAEGGGWQITQERYNELPSSIKRMIEHVEMRCIKGQFILGVTFVNKTQALRLAAAYTLTQHIEVDDKRTLPWDEIAGAKKSDAGEAVERRIAELERQAVPSTNGAH